MQYVADCTCTVAVKAKWYVVKSVPQNVLAKADYHSTVYLLSCSTGFAHG